MSQPSGTSIAFNLPDFWCVRHWRTMSRGGFEGVGQPLGGLKKRSLESVAHLEQRANLYRICRVLLNTDILEGSSVEVYYMEIALQA